MESKIPFLHSICSPPHLSKSHSPAETTLNSFSPIFLEFSVYISTSSHTPLLTHPQEGFTPGLSQYSTSFVRKALFVFVWLAPSVFCYCLLRIVTYPATSLFKQESYRYPHTPGSPPPTQPSAQRLARRRDLINACWMHRWVPQVHHTHRFFPLTIHGGYYT